jgi:hypothetical protein
MRHSFTYAILGNHNTYYYDTPEVTALETLISSSSSASSSSSSSSAASSSYPSNFSLN